MKKIFFAAFMLATVSTTFATVGEPLPKISISKSSLETSCTVIAYGIYTAPDGEQVDVRCSKSAESCAQASIDANRCRDLNVCREVRSRFIEPSPTLNCPPISEIGD